MELKAMPIVLALNNDLNVLSEIKKSFERDFGQFINCENVNVAIQKIFTYRCGVYIFDNVPNNTLEILYEFVNVSELNNVYFIFLSNVSKVVNSKIYYCKNQDVITCIKDIKNKLVMFSKNINLNSTNYSFALTKLLTQIKLPTKLIGYSFIKDCIACLLRDGHNISFHKYIYPLIASKNFSSPVSVEKNIRNCIGICYLRNKEYFNQNFDGIKPSNKHFIKYLAYTLEQKL